MKNYSSLSVHKENTALLSFGGKGGAMEKQTPTGIGLIIYGLRLSTDMLIHELSIIGGRCKSENMERYLVEGFAIIQ